MTDTVISYGEYAAGLARLAKEGREATAELEAAHKAEAEAERAYRIRRSEAYAEVDAPAAGQRDAKVDALSADHRKARDIARGRVQVATEVLREIRSRRSSSDELARYGRRLLEMDSPGPDVARLARRETA